MQDIEIKNKFSMFYAKTYTTPETVILWKVVNTYVIEIFVIASSVYLIYKNRFGKLGYLTIIVTVIFWSVWLYYWNIM